MIRLIPISTEKITPATAAPRGGACARAGSRVAVGIIPWQDSTNEPCDAFFSAAAPAISGSFCHMTSIINTGAVGTGAPRHVEFMLRAVFQGSTGNQW